MVVCATYILKGSFIVSLNKQFFSPKQIIVVTTKLHEIWLWSICLWTLSDDLKLFKITEFQKFTRRRLLNPSSYRHTPTSPPPPPPIIQVVVSIIRTNSKSFASTYISCHADRLSSETFSSLLRMLILVSPDSFSAVKSIKEPLTRRAPARALAL